MPAARMAPTALPVRFRNRRRDGEVAGPLVGGGRIGIAAAAGLVLDLPTRHGIVN